MNRQLPVSAVTSGMVTVVIQDPLCHVVVTTSFCLLVDTVTDADVVDSVQTEARCQYFQSSAVS